MQPVTHETILHRLQWRYATKKFDPSRIIPDAEWRALEEALVLTPSSYGLQPWKFIVVTNRELRERLVGHSWGQKQIVDASHLVVMAIKRDLGRPEIERFVQRVAEVRGVPVESLVNFHRMMAKSLVPPPAGFDINEWATRQVYIALGNFMTAAALMGIDTCPMEGIDPVKYDEVLGLTALGYSTVVACPAGHRASDDKHATQPKVRFKSEDVILRLA
jgi:nitroreductase